MADEATSTDTAAVEASVEKGQPSADQESTPRQEPGQTEQTSSGVNLQELEEFRDYQRQRDKTAAAERRRYDQEVARLRQELTQVRMRDMTTEERYQFEIQQREQQIAHLQQQSQQVYTQLAQQEAISSIASKLSSKTGVAVPHKVLSEADGPDDAWEKGLEYALKEKEKEMRSRDRQRQRKQEDAETPVDTGRGSPSATSSAAKTRRIEEAKKSGNVLDLIRAYASEGE